jgi:hypothetical protein
MAESQVIASPPDPRAFTDQLLDIVGGSLRWTTGDVFDQSQVDKTTLLNAATQWDIIAPPAWKGLADAGMAGSRFGWDLASQRFTLKSAFGTTRFVVPDAVRIAARQAAANLGSRLASLSAQASSGAMPLEQFQLQFADMLRQGHTALSAVGRGGLAQMDFDALKLTSDHLTDQFAFLERFVRSVEAGLPLANSPGVIAVRSTMYGTAAYQTWAESQRRSHQDAGFDEEQRILGDADHCPTCLDQGAEPPGDDDHWQPMGSYNQIGDSECNINCKCHFVYRRSEDAQRQQAEDEQVFGDGGIAGLTGGEV